MHIKKRRALKVYAEEKCILSPNTACGLSHVQKKEKSASRKVSSFKHAMFGHILNQQIYVRHVKVTPNMWRTVELGSLKSFVSSLCKLLLVLTKE